MRFVIKNYIKTSHGEKLYATFTDIVKDVSEAKEKYADILKNEEKSKIEKERRKIESDIENYKNLLRESEEKLRELIIREGD